MGVEIIKQGIWVADGSETGENLARYVTTGGNSPGNTSVAGRTNFYDSYGIIIPATENADTYFSIWYDTPLVNGQIYTLSGQVSGLLESSYYNFPLFAQNNSAMGMIKFNQNGLCYLTFTMNYSGSIPTATVNGKTFYRMFMDDNGRALASGQGKILIKNIKLEKGSKPTPWLPNQSDSIYVSSTVPFVETDKGNKLYIGQDYIDANQFYEI